MKKYSIGIVATIIVAVSILSCRKSDRNLDVSIKASQENAIATNLLMDAFFAVHHLAIEDTVVNGPQDTIQTNTKDGCLSLVSYSTSNNNFPMAVVMEFDGSSCSDTRLRSGRLSAKFSDRYSDTLSTMTISYSNYTVDGIKITGKQIITNKGKIGGVQTYDCSVQDVFLTADTLRIEFNASFRLEQTAGAQTVATSDDEFELSGKSNGRITAGSNYASIITTPLKVSPSCEWIIEGQASIDPDGLSARKVDFGTACDNQVFITNLGKEYTVTLP